MTRIGTRKYVLGGDIILSINNIKIENRESLLKIRKSLIATKNDQIPLTVLRAGKKVALKVKRK